MGEQDQRHGQAGTHQPQRLAVLGSPIAHSKSPDIHSAAYRVLGLDWSYGRFECEEPGLASLLAGLGSEWRGLSLTMPLKEEARRLASVLDPVAEESGVVNTLLRLAGGAGWAGFNTDVGGLAAAIHEAGLDATSTVVLGSGATAVSAILAVRSLGAQHVEVVARNASAITDLVARFDGTSGTGAGAPLRVSGMPLAPADPDAERTSRDPEVPEPTLVVSTLPGPAARGVQLPESILGTPLLGLPLFDVAYDPWPSPLAERWSAAGGVAHAGIGMLVRQALLQVRIFVTGDPGTPLEREDEVLAAMRSAGMGE